MNFDDTARLSAPRLPLPPALRNYLIRRFGALPSNWWELLTPKGLEYVKQYAGLSTAQAKHAKKLCRNCHKVEVQGIKRYCGKCARARKLAANRESYRRGLNSGKTKNSPIGAEALTKPKMQGGYTDPQTAKTASNFSTQKEAA
jgi:hypothetical protein